MKKFLAIYLGTMQDDSFKKWMAMPEAEKKQKEAEGMAAWGKWMEKNKAAFSDGGAPVGKNTQVTMNGAAQVPNDVGGYSIMQGESKEAVEAILAQSPHIKMPGTVTDVMEIVAMSG